MFNPRAYFISPKGTGSRVKFRNLITGKVIDKTYKSESVEEADVMTVEMSYLYSDGEQWHFMNSSTYEQIAINNDVVGDAKKWIIGQENCEVVIGMITHFS